jgi:hypothetical protein
MTDPISSAPLDTCPEAHAFLYARTSSAEEASHIFNATLSFLQGSQADSLPKEVIDFFRLKPTGKTWWYNLVDLIDYLAAIKARLVMA